MKTVSILVAIILCIGVNPASACSDVPDFSARVERGALPARPGSPVTVGELETYRVDWESARELIIEGYNRRLKSYGERLVLLDVQLQREVSAGICPPESAEARRGVIRYYLQLASSDLLYEYEELVGLYQSQIKWYKYISKLLRTCKSLGGCERGYEL